MTEPLDHESAKRHAEGILKRGSAFSNPAKNLARCYLDRGEGYAIMRAECDRKCADLERQIMKAAELNEKNAKACSTIGHQQTREVAALRDEVDRYRELAHELAFMVANLTSSKVPQ